MGAAQQHLLAVEAHAQEAAKMVAEMGAQDAMSAEFAEGITQNEAAAMAAVSEAQQQVAAPTHTSCSCRHSHDACIRGHKACCRCRNSLCTCVAPCVSQ